MGKAYPRAHEQLFHLLHGFPWKSERQREREERGGEESE